MTRRQVARLMALAVGLGVTYALGALLTFVFLDAPEAGVAFFPSAGLTFSFLVLTRRRLWPLWLVAIVIAEVSVDVTHGQSWWMAIGFAAANCAEPVCGASIVQHLSRPARRDLRRDLVVFLAGGVVAGPIVGALIGATVATHTAGTATWLGVFWRWWLGDAVGVLVVALPILIWAARTPFEPPLAVRRIAATTVIAVVVTLVPALLWQHPMLYCVLPVLMASAIVGDRMAAAVAGLGVAFAADWAAVTGRADDLLASTAPGEKLVYVQLFLAVTIVAAQALAVEVLERQRAERELWEAREERNLAAAASRDATMAVRRHLAHEVHDLVGHALNVALLQAGAARRAVDRDPELARDLLLSMEANGREAFRDLDVALRLIGDEPPEPGHNGLGDLADLVDVLRSAGVDVRLVEEGCPGPVPVLVDRSAFRIVQESLTNAARHAPGAEVEVRVHHGDVAITVEIVNGPSRRHRAPGPGRRVGHGLIGMQERTTMLGGTFLAAPRPGGGFSVRARLPKVGT